MLRRRHGVHFQRDHAQGPTSLLRWDLHFKDNAIERSFQRGQDIVLSRVDWIWGLFLAIVGVYATFIAFDNFVPAIVYLNTCSCFMPVVLQLAFPSWYMRNRRLILTSLKAKHMIMSPWRGRTFTRMDTAWAVFFSSVFTSRTWVQPSLSNKSVCRIQSTSFDLFMLYDVDC